jgi:hypothetical protein
LTDDLVFPALSVIVLYPPVARSSSIQQNNTFGVTRQTPNNLQQSFGRTIIVSETLLALSHSALAATGLYTVRANDRRIPCPVQMQDCRRHIRNLRRET